MLVENRMHRDSRDQRFSASASLAEILSEGNRSEISYG
jgi:hypothetical protein